MSHGTPGPGVDTIPLLMRVTARSVNHNRNHVRPDRVQNIPGPLCRGSGVLPIIPDGQEDRIDPRGHDTGVCHFEEGGVSTITKSNLRRAASSTSFNPGELSNSEGRGGEAGPVAEARDHRQGPDPLGGELAGGHLRSSLVRDMHARSEELSQASCRWHGPTRSRGCGT